MQPKCLELSSRIQSMDKGGSSSGASCNTWVVEDSISGIFDAVKWSAEIAQRQGAPTLILSNIRPSGSGVALGGTASGPCSFAKVFDSTASAMLRPGKKNGVVVLFLDADHPDIEQWISPEFKSTLVRAYTGVLFRPNKKYSPELIHKIANAYDRWEVSFLCKTTIGMDGETLYPNVCTEIRQAHKGQCVLGAIDLSRMARYSATEFVEEFKSCALTMLEQLEINRRNAEQEPDLFAFERQVGLGFVGMANLLGAMGVTYEDAVVWLETELDGLGVDLSDTEMESDEFMEWLAHKVDGLSRKVDKVDPAGQFWLRFIGGVIAGSVAVGDKLDRLWTSQPTAHTSLRLGKGRVNLSKPYLKSTTGDERELVLSYIKGQGWKSIHTLTDEQSDQVVIDLNLPTPIARIGNAVAAELQPPHAVRVDGHVLTAIHQSQLKGSIELVYPRMESRDEVPYDIYYRFAVLIQSIFDFTGKAHTLSHCTWKESIDGDFVQRWLDGPLGSLYYRLEPTSARYLDKTETWDGVDLSDLFEAPSEPKTQFCPLPKPGQGSDCEVCSM